MREPRQPQGETATWKKTRLTYVVSTPEELRQALRVRRLRSPAPGTADDAATARLRACRAQLSDPHRLLSGLATDLLSGPSIHQTSARHPHYVTLIRTWLVELRESPRQARNRLQFGSSRICRLVRSCKWWQTKFREKLPPIRIDGDPGGNCVSESSRRRSRRSRWTPPVAESKR